MARINYNLYCRTISLLGLLFIAIGTGGIKPCVSAFGGDQFVLPEQSLQLQRFFSFFYFSINAGSMISTFLTPALRNDVKCFGQNSCFPLAFGVPAILMIVSVGTKFIYLTFFISVSLSHALKHYNIVTGDYKKIKSKI